MKFGKLTNGMLTEAPAVLTENGKVHYHPTEEMYLARGYLPIENTPYPEGDETKFYTSSWIEENGVIVRTWTESLPQAPLPTLAERVAEIEARQAEQESINAEVSDALVELAEIVTEVA